ncbi:hypothetical protein [Streptomyces sp. BH055]|uniref:hypothetical protein n=1 Tax=unclassified Streptomyces TaxID=2593676 RepID=UPI003BB6F916
MHTNIPTAARRMLRRYKATLPGERPFLFAATAPAGSRVVQLVDGRGVVFELTGEDLGAAPFHLYRALPVDVG